MLFPAPQGSFPTGCGPAGKSAPVWALHSLQFLQVLHGHRCGRLFHCGPLHRQQDLLHQSLLSGLQVDLYTSTLHTSSLTTVFCLCNVLPLLIYVFPEVPPFWLLGPAMPRGGAVGAGCVQHGAASASPHRGVPSTLPHADTAAIRTNSTALQVYVTSDYLAPTSGSYWFLTAPLSSLAEPHIL